MPEKKSVLIAITLRLRSMDSIKDLVLIINGRRFKDTNALNVERPLVKT